MSAREEATRVTHTPGPWHSGRPDMGTVVDGVISKWIYGGADGHEYVAIASGRISRTGPSGWDEVMANARLIAAAPDLLEAARRALVALATYTTFEDEADELRAAIAKAEGRSA